MKTAKQTPDYLGSEVKQIIENAVSSTQGSSVEVVCYTKQSETSATIYILLAYRYEAIDKIHLGIDENTILAMFGLNLPDLVLSYTTSVNSYIAKMEIKYDMRNPEDDENLEYLLREYFN